MIKRGLVCVATAGIAWAGVASADSMHNYATHLTGASEVPARDTPAQGQATIAIAGDEESLVCKLMASNIDNVVQAHIHLGQPGTNGPVVAFLYGLVASGGGPQDGRLSETTITEESLVGPLDNHDISELIAAIRAGNAYVNVHTNDGVGLPNSGPGDFPGGEVRGQIE